MWCEVVVVVFWCVVYCDEVFVVGFGGKCYVVLIYLVYFVFYVCILVLFDLDLIWYCSLWCNDWLMCCMMCYVGVV